jgi:hypothetical protein
MTLSYPDFWDIMSVIDEIGRNGRKELCGVITRMLFV